MVTFRKVYKTNAKGKRVVAGTLTTNKAGKSGYKIIDHTPRKKATWKEFKYAFARDSGLLKRKFDDAVSKLGLKKLSTGEYVGVIDKGSKNIIEAKGIAYDAQSLPSVDAPNTRNTSALKYTPKQKDYKITSASANKKRTSGGRVLTTPTPVRMSNVVELENFVQKNMAAVSKTSGGANTMREDYKINSLMANKPRTSGGRVKKKNPAAEWWRKTGGTTVPNYGDYNTIGQNTRNLKKKNNKSFQMPAWWKKMKARYNADQDAWGNPR